MALTPAQIQSLINTNLADASNITPAEHREVETELLNLLKLALPLAKGSLQIGDIGVDQWYTISFPNVGTSNYYVLGSLKSKAPSYNNDNDHTWVWREQTSTSFIFAIRDFGGNVSNLEFFWELKAI